MKLMIAIPTLDYIHRKFVESLTGLTKNLVSLGIDFDVCYEGYTLVYISRDNLVKRAVEGNYDWILWLDADMVFEPDIFGKLFECRNETEFVTGMYKGRHGSGMPCIFDKLEPPKRWEEFKYSDKPLLIEGCGFGCALTSVNMCDDILNENGTCFTPTPSLGEDLAFCKRAKNLGYPLYVRTDISIGHIAQTILWNNKEDERM